jgi:hypothetical protein
MIAFFAGMAGLFPDSRKDTKYFFGKMRYGIRYRVMGKTPHATVLDIPLCERGIEGNFKK